MGWGSIKLHHGHGVSQLLGKVIQKLLEVFTIEFVVGLSPLPPAQRLHNSIEPERFPGPFNRYFGLDAFSRNHSFGLRFATDATLVLSQVAQLGNVSVGPVTPSALAESFFKSRDRA